MKHKTLRALVECAVFVALSIALSYVKIPIGMTFGGFGGPMMTAAPFGMGGFGGMEFAPHAARPVNKIVPISPDAALAAAPIEFDESGELVVRPFDDEDLFVED